MTSATEQPVPAAPRLIATDLDGTLLRDDKTVSDRTVAALAAAEEAGIEVFFVTGRPARWMDVVSDHVHGHGLAICANGAAVADLHAGGRLLKVRALERPTALDVVRTLRAAAPGPRSPSNWPPAFTTNRPTRPSTWTPVRRWPSPRSCFTRRRRVAVPPC